MRRVWKAACTATRFEISLYEGTKHSRATDLLRDGVSERVLQALLGNRDARSTRGFARLADETLVDAIRPRSGSNVDPLRNRPKKQLRNQRICGGGAGNRTRVRTPRVSGAQMTVKAALSSIFSSISIRIAVARPPNVMPPPGCCVVPVR